MGSYVIEFCLSHWSVDCRKVYFCSSFILGFLSTKPVTLILSCDAFLLLCPKIKPYKVKEQTTEGEEMTNELST